MTSPPSGQPASAPPKQVPPVPAPVAAALARLAGLDEAPVRNHVEVFDEVHRLLQDALATLDRT